MHKRTQWNKTQLERDFQTKSKAKKFKWKKPFKKKTEKRNAFLLGIIFFLRQQRTDSDDLIVFNV